MAEYSDNNPLPTVAKIGVTTETAPMTMTTPPIPSAQASLPSMRCLDVGGLGELDVATIGIDPDRFTHERDAKFVMHGADDVVRRYLDVVLGGS